MVKAYIITDKMTVECRKSLFTHRRDESGIHTTAYIPTDKIVLE